MIKSVLCCCSAALIISTSSTGAEPADRTVSGRELAKSTAPTDYDYTTTINANQLEMFVTNAGLFAHDIAGFRGRQQGLYYPNGTENTLLYSAGLWIGGMVDNQLRVSGADYVWEFWPGPMQDGTYQPEDPSFRVYKIVQDLYINGFYNGQRPDTDPEMARLWDDYHNWPADEGAPVDGDGKPLFVSAQTLWCVYNDACPDYRYVPGTSALGLGVEIQQTTVAFDRSSGLGNCIFMKYLIINKSGLNIKDAYVSFWAEPEIGQYNDDFVGCDSVFNVGYAYNSCDGDKIYGPDPPAIGFCILQGPAVPTPGDSALFNGRWLPNFRNLPMTAGIWIEQSDPSSPQQVYNVMQGLSITGDPIINPITNTATTYYYSGDPVTQTGWMDCCTHEVPIIQTRVECFEVAGPGGAPVEPPVDVACKYNSTGQWFVASWPECDFTRMDWRGNMGEETWEIRFRMTGSEYHDWDTEEKYADRAPFEVWNIGTETPDDPLDERRLQFAILDDDESGGWSPGDRIYVIEREYYEPLPDLLEYTWDDDFKLGRIIFSQNQPWEGTAVTFAKGLPDTTYDTVTTDGIFRIFRQWVSAGPFDMAPDDTQEVVMGVIVGQGPDHLASITDLRENIVLARAVLEAGLQDCDCSGIGDCSGDGQLNLLDIVHFINYALFNGAPPPTDEDCPVINRGDFNCDDSINLIDLVLMVNYVYRQPAPGPCDPCIR